MKKIPTSPKSLLLVLALTAAFSLFLSISIQAQPPMAPTFMLMPANMNRQLVFAKNNTFLPSHYMGRIPLLRHLYTVVLKNGRTYAGKTKMQLNNGRSYLKLKEKGGFKRFYPKDTRQIYIVSKKGRKMIGHPDFGDSSWLFQVSEGPINTFAVIPEWETIFISAVQKDTLLPPLRIKQPTIVQMVSDNPKALKKAKKRRLMDAIVIYNKAKK